MPAALPLALVDDREALVRRYLDSAYRAGYRGGLPGAVAFVRGDAADVATALGVSEDWVRAFERGFTRSLNPADLARGTNVAGGGASPAKSRRYASRSAEIKAAYRLGARLAKRYAESAS